MQRLDRFERRSSLETWMFRIVINEAMTKGGQDARSVPFSSPVPDEPAVDPVASTRPGDGRAWLSEDAVTPIPDRVALAQESRALIDAVIAALPPNQRLVIALRDVQGFTAEEVCHLLEVIGSSCTGPARGSGRRWKAT